eukprot:TRINITY_DN2327_c0_g1_i1.p1 TRINITY_DN2327_c0_g1~~TRINITY_DN2327_c0_g1_i1.p1  ORF type:complete len:234 (-),score=55.41 TRINITY_DN2327_c0_g1_i1:704-1357(-)
MADHTSAVADRYEDIEHALNVDHERLLHELRIHLDEAKARHDFYVQGIAEQALSTLHYKAIEEETGRTAEQLSKRIEQSIAKAAVHRAELLQQRPVTDHSDAVAERLAEHMDYLANIQEEDRIKIEHSLKEAADRRRDILASKVGTTDHSEAVSQRRDILFASNAKTDAQIRSVLDAALARHQQTLAERRQVARRFSVTRLHHQYNPDNSIIGKASA